MEDFRLQKTRKHVASSIDKKDVERRFWCPHWDHATDSVKGLAWSMVAYEHRAYSMSVNLGDDVIAIIKKKGPGFSKHLAERIRTHLRRRLEPKGMKVPEFFFWVEKPTPRVEAKTRVREHIHGAILIDHNEPDMLEQVVLALRTAGGSWAPLAKQVHLKPLYTPARWLTYMTKWEPGTKLRLGDDSVSAATTGMRQMARRWYEDARKGVRPIA